MIITITLNAALDRTQRIEHPLQVGKLNRRGVQSSGTGRPRASTCRARSRRWAAAVLRLASVRHKRPHYEGHADSSGHSPRFC